MIDVQRYRWSSENIDDRFDVTDPSTGLVTRSVQGGDSASVDGAVRAAHAAYAGDWRWRSGRERGAMMQEISRRILAHAGELAELETRENGKPLMQAHGDVQAAALLFDYFGGLAGKLPGEFFDGGALYGAAMLEPYGVIGAIIPFNWPPIHTAGKLAPALAVGNAIVIKPPEQVPSVVMRMIEIIQQVLPPDVVHGVPGGGMVGKALASHPLVGKVSFTGAPATGAAVIKSSADQLTPTLMELGGKNAMIVLADADVDRALRFIFEAGYFNQGEACTAGSRVLIHASLYDAMVDRLGQAVTRLQVGAGLAPGIHVGPLVTREQQRRVLDYLRIAREEGATIAAEGGIPSDPALANGFWVRPTLLSGVTPDMRVAREEIFGPVVSAIRFDEVDQAVEIANGTPFGLTCAIFTRDYPLAMRMARKIDVGMVFVDNYFRGGVFGMPFGGTKASGYGREHTIATLREFGREKLIAMPSGLGPMPHWPAVSDVGL